MPGRSFSTWTTGECCNALNLSDKDDRGRDHQCRGRGTRVSCDSASAPASAGPAIAISANEGTAAEASEVLREVRLGLVLNGGVSLAVDGGVTMRSTACAARMARLTERSRSSRDDSFVPPAAPRAPGARGRGRCCRGEPGGDDECVARGDGVRGDAGCRCYVMCGSRWGASKLSRSPSKREPPSLSRGDGHVLPQLEQNVLHEILGRGGPRADGWTGYICRPRLPGLPRGLLKGFRRQYGPSSVQELEHRRVFRFRGASGTGRPGAEEREAVAGEEEAALAGQLPRLGEMPTVCGFDRPTPPICSPACTLLVVICAVASRRRTSLPGRGGTALADRRWRARQPASFNPVLNRIATVAAGDRPVRRVVGYIVPYVTERTRSRGRLSKLTKHQARPGQCSRQQSRLRMRRARFLATCQNWPAWSRSYGSLARGGAWRGRESGSTSSMIPTSAAPLRRSFGPIESPVTRSAWRRSRIGPCRFPPRSREIRAA